MPLSSTPLFRRLSELGIVYRGSPIVQGDGKRYFDDSLRGGNGIRSRCLLLLGDEVDSSTKEAAERLCKSLKDAVELRRTPDHDVILVRPDGYIASSAPNRHGIAAMRSIRSLLARWTDCELGNLAAS